MKKEIFVMFMAIVLFSACGKKDAVASSSAGSTASVTDSYQVTFLELGSVNCVPCKMMVPVMDKIRSNFAGKVRVMFIDVWTSEGKPYGEQLGIRAIPTQVILNVSNYEIHRHEGFWSYEEVVSYFESIGLK